MRYEHLIEINNPLLPLLDTLRWDDVWAGLVARAYSPQRFTLGLEDARVATISDDGTTTVLSRTLDYGSFEVHDRVTLRRQGAVMITEAAGNEGVTAARLTITLEEPAAERLYLRFLYEFGQEEAENAMDAITIELRKQAYFAADMDTVARIRELAAQRRRP